jgi:RecJ-like exonuclease
MPTCPSCKGKCKIIDSKYKVTVTCNDCDGRGIVSDKTLKFIEYYNRKKLLDTAISVLENDVDVLVHKDS